MRGGGSRWTRTKLRAKVFGGGWKPVEGLEAEGRELFVYILYPSSPFESHTK